MDCLAVKPELAAKLPPEIKAIILKHLGQTYVDISRGSKCSNDIKSFMKYVIGSEYRYPMLLDPWNYYDGPDTWIYLGRRPAGLQDITKVLQKASENTGFPEYTLPRTNLFPLLIGTNLCSPAAFTNDFIFGFDSQSILAQFLRNSPGIELFGTQISSICIRLDFKTNLDHGKPLPQDIGFKFLEWFVTEVEQEPSFLPKLMSLEIELLGFDLRGRVRTEEPMQQLDIDRFARLRYLVTVALRLMHVSGRDHKILVKCSGFTANIDHEGLYAISDPDLDNEALERETDHDAREILRKKQREIRQQREIVKYKGMYWDVEPLEKIPSTFKLHFNDQRRQIENLEYTGHGPVWSDWDQSFHQGTNKQPFVPSEAFEQENYIWLLAFERELAIALRDPKNYAGKTNYGDLYFPFETFSWWW